MDKKAIRNSMLQAVEEQLEKNTPPETKQTLDRLMSEGWSMKDAKTMIGQCIMAEIFWAVKSEKPADNDQFIKNLKNLPKEPLEGEPEDDLENRSQDTSKETQTLPAGIKIGRNEKVSVKYTDGRIEESIKFKKVKDDLLTGLCELME